MISEPASEPVPVEGDFRPYRGSVRRIVEGQHRISTNRLIEDPADQQRLEAMVEEVKPTMPAAARKLHYLLGTPFRYGYSKASRFRRAGERPGIFYASEQVSTAIAETAYWRLLFFSRSPGMSLPAATIEHSALTVEIGAEKALDLSAEPLSAGHQLWTDPHDYEPCQHLAAAARQLGTELIRYVSARDSAAGANIALLSPDCFKAPEPSIEQTWHFRFEGRKLTAFAAFPSEERYSFTFEQFRLAPP